MRDEPVDMIGKQISESVHQSMPVCRGDLDHVVGILNAKDILNKMLQGGSFEMENASSLLFTFRKHHPPSRHLKPSAKPNSV
jgi:CBS domain containing-hemolysin-like protein